MNTPRLLARPSWEATGSSGTVPGTRTINTSTGQAAQIFVPSIPSKEYKFPVVLVLHGTGGNSRSALELLGVEAEEHGVILVAPDSVGMSWDMITGPGFGPDVDFINTTLEHVFRRYRVDTQRVGVAGFSDGAAYALALGLSNGDLFSSVLAFSPGSIPEDLSRVGKPRIYISHGRLDDVIRAENGGKKLAEELKQDGYDVEYREFEGGHVVPEGLLGEAMQQFLE